MNMIIRNEKGQFIKGINQGYGFKKGDKAHLGFKHTEETIKKIKEARKRQIIEEEIKRRIG